MPKAAVRRVNEWDGPAMLKIYAPYVGTPAAPEEVLPELADYVRRIDRYTYGLGWLICEIDSQPVGFCHLSEDRIDPKNLFAVEFQLFVKPDMRGRGVGSALWTLMRDMMELGNRRKATARMDARNCDAIKFFEKIGFAPAVGTENGADGETVMVYELAPADPEAERPTKPYLLENLDYERARERAAELVKI